MDGLAALDEETWGEQFHRAYRRARARSGGDLTYREVAERISRFHPISDAAIIRWEARKEPPTQKRTRLVAYLVLVIYGFEPEGFGITRASTGVDDAIIDRAIEAVTADRWPSAGAA